MAKGLETARARTAARHQASAQGALEATIAYAREAQTVQHAIAEHQAIRFKIATMSTEVEAARQLLHYVCSAIDSRRRCVSEASMGEAVRRRWRRLRGAADLRRRRLH